MFSLETHFLVADDMPTMRELVKSQLRAMGYRKITEAADGDEALTRLLLAYKEDTPIDIVISDWNMPKMTGIDFLKQLRSNDKFKNLPFLLLTSESEKDQVTEAILAGVTQYLVKPFAPKSFEEKLKAVWARTQKK